MKITLKNVHDKIECTNVNVKCTFRLFHQTQESAKSRTLKLQIIFSKLNFSPVLFEKIFIWDKIFESGLSKFFKDFLPQNLLSPLLNTLSRLIGDIK